MLGARGAGFVRRIALGTTAERLLRTTRRPLLVVKQKAHERYRRVLVPVDFSPSSAQALALARRVAPDARRSPDVVVPIVAIADMRMAMLGVAALTPSCGRCSLRRMLQHAAGQPPGRALECPSPSASPKSLPA